MAIFNVTNNKYISSGLTSFNVSSSALTYVNDYHCDGTIYPDVDTVLYHDGVNDYPDIGDSIYYDSEGNSIFVASGTQRYLTDESELSTIYIVEGVVTEYTPGDCL